MPQRKERTEQLDLLEHLPASFRVLAGFALRKAGEQNEEESQGPNQKC